MLDFRVLNMGTGALSKVEHLIDAGHKAFTQWGVWRFGQQDHSPSWQSKTRGIYPSKFPDVQHTASVSRFAGKYSSQFGT